jgi:hypothetical protein
MDKVATRWAFTRPLYPGGGRGVFARKWFPGFGAKMSCGPLSGTQVNIRLVRIHCIWFYSDQFWKNIHIYFQYPWSFLSLPRLICTESVCVCVCLQESYFRASIYFGTLPLIP